MSSSLFRCECKSRLPRYVRRGVPMRETAHHCCGIRCPQEGPCGPRNRQPVISDLSPECTQNTRCRPSSSPHYFGILHYYSSAKYRNKVGKFRSPSDIWSSEVPSSWRFPLIPLHRLLPLTIPVTIGYLITCIAMYYG